MKLPFSQILSHTCINNIKHAAHRLVQQTMQVVEMALTDDSTL